MADHEHIEVLVEGVACVWASWIGRRRQDVRVFDDRYDIWSVAASSSFSMIGMNGSVLESGNRGLDEAGFIEGIGVY